VNYNLKQPTLCREFHYVKKRSNAIGYYWHFTRPNLQRIAFHTVRNSRL